MRLSVLTAKGSPSINRQLAVPPHGEISPNRKDGWRGKVISRRLGRIVILPDAFISVSPTGGHFGC